MPTPPTIQPINALAEANPASLDELFSRDPLKRGPDDIKQIVAELRKQRERWLAAEAAGAVRGPSRTGAKAPAKPGLDLADLGL